MRVLAEADLNIHSRAVVVVLLIELDAYALQDAVDRGPAVADPANAP